MAILTKRVALAHLRSPAANQIHFVLWQACHLGIPLANQLCVFIDLVRLHIVENDRMDIFAASQDLREAAFDVLV